MISCFYFLFSILFAYPACGASGRAETTIWERINESQAHDNVIYGYKYLVAGEYSKSALEFNAAINKNPKSAYARIGYGSALYWMGMPDKAYNEFEEAIKLDPENADAYQLRGIIKSARGQYDSALMDFKYAAKYAPGRGDIRMNMGSIYAVKGDMSSALSNYRRAVDLDRNSPLFRLQLARCYVSLGRETEAEKSYRKAISIYPDYEDAIFELAILLEIMGQDTEALKLYRKAIRLKPGDSVARFRLAVLLYRTGRKDEIRKTVMPGFAIAPPNEKGGISMGFSYSSRGRDQENRKNNDNESGKGNPADGGGGNNFPSGEKNDGKGQDKEYPRSDEILSRVPANHDVKLVFEVLELPKMELKQKTAMERNIRIGNKMSAAMAKPNMNYARKEYILPASSHEERAVRIAEIQEETEKMLTNVSPVNDVRVSINMETSARNGEEEADGGGNESQATARYIPRDVGNDMGLWIYGENWLESVSELLDDMSGYKNLSPEMRLVRGLGYLLMGETSLAAEDFSGTGIEEALGRSAAYTAAGNMKKAISECEKALSYDPKNRIAAQNLKWLKYMPKGKQKQQE